MDEPQNLPYVLEPVAELTGHDDRAWHVAWNPTRPLLATCSADKTVRMYHYRWQDGETDTNSAVTQRMAFTHVSTIQTEHTKTVRRLAWSPSGGALATASFDSNIGVWEQEAKSDMEDNGPGPTQGDWECASLLEGHETECKCVAYSASGTLLASCSRDKTVWIWEVHPDSEFECLAVLMDHGQDVKCVAWHPSEEILASASYDDTIKIYIDDTMEDWFCCATLQGHASTVWAIAWSPCGRFLASGSDDRTIRIWKREGSAADRWGPVCVLEGCHARSVYTVSWTAGGSSNGSLGWLASGGGDGRLNVWEVKNLEEEGKVECELIAVRLASHGVCDMNAAVWCPRDGAKNILATAGDDGKARLWRIIPARETSAQVAAEAGE